MKKITLFIDTTDRFVAKVALELDGIRYEKYSESKVLKSQMVLPLVEELLTEHNCIFSSLTEIIVNTGPGSFTGIRVGLSIANSIAALVHIPVNGKQSLAQATY